MLISFHLAHPSAGAVGASLVVNRHGERGTIDAFPSPGVGSLAITQSEAPMKVRPAALISLSVLAFILPLITQCSGPDPSMPLKSKTVDTPEVEFTVDPRDCKSLNDPQVHFPHGLPNPVIPGTAKATFRREPKPCGSGPTCREVHWVVIIEFDFRVDVGTRPISHVRQEFDAGTCPCQCCPPGQQRNPNTNKCVAPSSGTERGCGRIDNSDCPADNPHCHGVALPCM